MRTTPEAPRPRSQGTRASAWARVLAAPSLVAIVLCSTLAARGELVVLESGDVLKVSSYSIQQGSLLLELATGGRLRLPIGRVERILADEIVPPAEEASAPIVEPAFDLDFKDSHPVPPAPYGPLIHDAARRHQVNPSLVAAMVRCESAFDADAVSPRGARGLLQLMPATAERFGIDPAELDDPARNLEAGVRYLRWLADRFDNDLPMVLAAFNSGEGTVDRYRGVPPYRETREYLRRVYVELGL